MTDPKENKPKIPPELHESIARAITGDQWVKDKPNILSAESLSKIETALKHGAVFGHHCHYYGGQSLDNWAFLDFNPLREYLSQSRSGDLYIAWSVKDLEKKKLVLAHGQSSSNMEDNSLFISPEDLQTVRQYLSVPYHEIINVYISWSTRTVAIDYGDIDSYEDLEGDIREHTRVNSEIYIFPLTDIDKPDHYLVKAKYPNAKVKFQSVEPINRAAQHSVHPTGGSRRVFRHFAWLQAGSAKIALSPPAHPRVTHTVGQPLYKT